MYHVSYCHFKFYAGKYYLVEYANTPSYIAPFQGVRYYQREFARGNRGPLKAKRLFNPHHSFLWSAIERIFGVVKSQFLILKNASHHYYDNTTKIVIARCVLYNFIRTETSGED